MAPFHKIILLFVSKGSIGHCRLGRSIKVSPLFGAHKFGIVGLGLWSHEEMGVAKRKKAQKFQIDLKTFVIGSVMSQRTAD